MAKAEKKTPKIKPASKPALSPGAATVVRQVTENYRKAPHKWTFDLLPYSEHFEDVVRKAVNSDDAGTFRLVAGEALRELLRRRKSGKIIRRIHKSKDAA